MNMRQAWVIARERWGRSAYVRVAKDGTRRVGVVVPNKMDMRRLHGWGATWEEAFVLADVRLEILKQTIRKVKVNDGNQQTNESVS